MSRIFIYYASLLLLIACQTPQPNSLTIKKEHTVGYGLALCSGYKTEGGCKENWCQWDKQTTQCYSPYLAICEYQTDKQGCDGNSCVWQEKSKTCISPFTGNCEVVFDQTTCGNLMTCTWSEKNCVNKVRLCQLYKKKKDCTAVADCMWENDNCLSKVFMACGSAGDNKDLCTKIKGCAFDKGSQQCLRYAHESCNFNTQPECEKQVSCGWYNDRCLPKAQGCMQLNALTCNFSSNCIWDENSNTCFDKTLSSCEYAKNEHICHNLYGCTWEGGACTGTYHLMPLNFCSQNLNAKTCTKNRCAWDKTTNICLDPHFDTCQYAKSDETCHHMENCSWSQVDKECQNDYP